jgi:hypothetical protein
MEWFSALFVKRLARCRARRVRAQSKEEADTILAEEHGLLDAVLGRNRLEMYNQDQQSRRESYEIGLLDGQILLGLQEWSDGRLSLLRILKQWWHAHNPLSR